MARQFSRRVFSVALVAAAAAAMTTQAHAASYKLRFSDLGPPKGFRAEAVMWWADEVKKRTNGQVEVEFFWSQSLLKAKDTLKGVGSGLADAGSVFGIYSPSELPLWALASAPFGVADVWVGTRTWQALLNQSRALNAELAKYNVKMLASYSTGPVDFVSKKPLTKVADFKGMKIRSSGGWSAMLKNVGAAPVSIGFSEVHQALDKGVVDASVGYIPTINSYKLNEVAEHLTIANCGQVNNYGIGINKKLFDEMPKDIQQVILEVSDQYMDVQAEKFYASFEADKKALSEGEHALKVHVMAESERQKLEAASSDYIDDWKDKVKAKGGDPETFLKEFKAMRQYYELELKTKGYPWKR